MSNLDCASLVGNRDDVSKGVLPPHLSRLRIRMPSFFDPILDCSLKVTLANVALEP